VIRYLALLLLAACSSDFDPGSRVTKLRVLAVRADLPIARAGETVTLDALAFDPAARPVTWGWATCPDPRSSTTAECLRGMDPSSLVIEPGRTRHTITVPEAALVGVVVVACPGTLSRGDTSGVPFTCVSEGRALGLGEFEVGVKRLLVRARDRNANPEILSVEWDGAPWPEDEVKQVIPCATTGNNLDDCPAHLRHRVALRTGAPESGVDERGVPFSEQTVTQYYATEGIFEHEARVASEPETTWIARVGPEIVTMWLVARDDRGGIAFTSRRIRTR
jgi:hypothetical protein